MPREYTQLKLIQRGLYGTPGQAILLEKVRGSWFLKQTGTGGHGILGCWTGSVKEALTWAQNFINGTHTINGVPVKPMTPTKDLNEKQAEISEAIRAAKALLAALECAESCETEADFEANLQDALDNTEEVMKEIEALK
jgi:hypothetical protein